MDILRERLEYLPVAYPARIFLYCTIAISLFQEGRSDRQRSLKFFRQSGMTPERPLTSFAEREGISLGYGYPFRDLL